MNNLYFPGSLPGLDPRTDRVIKDLFDRVNYLTTELGTLRARDISILPIDAARRENPQKGIITIPGSGRDGFIRVNEYGVIVSYASPILSGSSQQSLLFTDPTDHANSGASETTVVTVTIPSGTLKQTGDFLEYVGVYDLQSVAVTKTIKYKFNGSDINANPWNNVLASTQITEIGRIYRTSPTSVRSYIACSLPFAAQVDPFTQFGDLSSLPNMDTSPIDFVVTIQGTNTNDITQRLGHLFVVVQN